MDGRDFGPPRSVHLPPPLLAGLAMESHRLGAAAAAGRIPPSPGHLGATHPPPLHSGKFLPSAINLHPHHSDAFPTGSSPFLSGYPGPSPLTSDPAYRSANPSSLQMAQLWASHAHEGYPPLPSSLYSSPYLSLSQHPLYDSHKEGFFLPASLSQSPLHPPSAHPTAPSSSTPPQRTSRDCGRDRPYRGERDRDRDRDRERERTREEQRPHSVVDLTQEGRSDEDRRARSGDRDREKERDRESEREREIWPFHPHLHQQKSHSQPSTVETRPRPSPPQPSFPSGGGVGRFHGPETDRGVRDEEGVSRPHHNHHSNNSNSHLDRLRRNDSEATSAGALNMSYVLPPVLQPSVAGLPHPSTSRESMREQRVSAPTYVPSVEVYDERAGPIQIASQARDNKNGDKQRDRERERERDRERERNRERDRENYRFPERSLMDHPRLSQSGDSSNQREEGSIICSNGSIGKRGQDTLYSSSQSRFSPESRDKHSVRMGMERAGAEPKWNNISPLANYATTHMAALAAQHGHRLSSPHSQSPQTQISHSPHATHRPNSNTHSRSHSPQTHTSQHGHGRAGEEGSQRRYLDPSALYRTGGSLVGGSSGGERGGAAGSDPSEVSAMQSLIKYSGNFASEGPGSSRHATDSRVPFGGLGSICMNAERERDRDRERLAVGSSVSGALRVPPQLKREQERPDSARSFGREAEGEVRHPPVGIAVAVARQRDSGSNTKPTSGSSDSQRPLLQTAIKDEERGEERAHHHDDRLLASRLEREQDKVLREPKELAEFSQMHPSPLSGGLTPSMMTPSLMTPNLMVTGAGRWPPDPSTLTSHPWMPRPGAPPVWLSSTPYSLGPSSLHQTLPPGYPPSLPGSLPPSYQFARDPQSGQLIVIPTEHLPHYGGDVLERGAPVWSGVYGTGSSLQHAAQLQLLSQHQMLRQQELLMIQQHTAQVLELQRSAQLVERLKASEHRPEIEDKADKRNTEPKPRPSSISSPSASPVLHPRKPPPPSRSPTPSTSSLTPLPPLPSPVTTLKSEEGGQRVLHSPMPLPHPPSPRSALPPPSSPRQPKQETAEVEELVRRSQREGQRPGSAAFQGIYSDLPPGYPYQSITAPFGSPFPSYPIPPPSGPNTELLPTHCSHSSPSAAPLPSTHLHTRLLDTDIKSQKLEPSKTGSFLKQEPRVEQPQLDMTPEPLPPLYRSSPPRASEDREIDEEATKPQLQPLPLHIPTPPPQQDANLEIREPEKERGKIKMEVSSYSCQAAYSSPPLLTQAEPKPKAVQDPEQTRYPPCITADSDCQESAQSQSVLREQTAGTTACEREQQHDTPTDLHIPSQKEVVAETPVYPPATSDSPPLLVIGPEDPMAGMLALLAASEMASQTHPNTPPAPILLPQTENPPVSADCSSTGTLEMVALEGMALLSQMAQREMENISQGQDLTLEGLDCLLEASRQILLEAIEKQSHINLPRTLDPNKKYSWRQRKEEPLYSKMSDMLDTVEVEYRVRLAELQKTYKDKQRELSKLQRRRDKHERQQQEDERRSLTRRGRGRPRKRKHLVTPPKLDSRPAKVGKTVQYSEDSEAGEGQRKRFRVSREEEETETGSGGVKVKKKKKKKSWSEQEPSTSHAVEVLKAKQGHVCEQEQLASDLDRALSLSQLSSLGASRKLASNTKPDMSKGKSADSRMKERSNHSPAKGGKHKMTAKASTSETVQKVKGQKKTALFSPVRSELSSCSNNSDSEEHSSARGGWPPLSGTRSHGNLTRKRRSASSPTSLLSGQKSQKKKHKHLSLLLEEAGLSSSDDSFDQGY